MLPDLIPHYSVGPFFGLAANLVMSILCLATLVPYSHYRPLRSLFFFYLFSTLLYLGWVIYGFQKNPESILLGYRIDLAALALLPATWVWFISALFNERPGWLSWIMTALSLFLACMAIFGRGPYLLGFPLEPHQISPGILRPQSKLLRPLVHSFCLGVCLFYLSLIVRRLLRTQRERPIHLLPIAIGLLFWLLGGVHDALRSTGITFFMKGQVLWFTSFWLSLFLTVGVALHFRSLERSVREARDVFERFVPPAYLRRIAIKGLGSIRLGEADQQTVTILCSDIRGFTPLSERLSPRQLVGFLNQLLERITPVVGAREGVIDKYLGDAVLCSFEGPDSAERAVACAVEMLTAVRGFNEEECRPADQKVQIGIGLHTGPVILGTIGSSERMDSTVLGLTVNLAKRLEEATRPLGVSVLASQEVLKRLPPRHVHRIRSLGEILLRGSSVPVAIAEVFDQDPPDTGDLKDLTEPLITEGTQLFKKGRLEAALSKLEEAQSIFPEDLPLKLLVSSLRRRMERREEVGQTALLDFR
jgi:class 3 adenylate cyclase